MHKYIPGTQSGKQEMLDVIGVSDVDELFSSIPDEVKLKRKLNLDTGKSELELDKKLRTIAKKNKNTIDNVCFLGAGAYDHYCPSAVDQLLLRQEFFTAYTPYQAEISQGTLQAAFEYQSYICMLTAMDVTNASMYDGATALAEAAFMACSINGKNEVLISRSVNPQSRRVLKTYAKFRSIEIKEVDIVDGTTDDESLKELISKDTAALILQSPNFFGSIEDIPLLAQTAQEKGALVIQSCDPMSLALLEAPGEMGVDIAVGDGQSLGLPLSFGGPYLGFLATRHKHVRKMPGRIIGQTVDTQGRTGYVMTMQAREQHIRRQKATSNICSNHALNALAVTMYLSLLGKSGLEEAARQSMSKAHYAYAKLIETNRFEPAFSAPFFLEFAVSYKGNFAELNKKLLDHGIIGGYDVSKDYPELSSTLLLAVTEKRTKAEIDDMVKKAVSK